MIRLVTKSSYIALPRISSRSAIHRFSTGLSTKAVAFAAFLLCLTPCLQAENIVFPPNSGVIDITKAPYYADNTGQTDVSDILTQALNDERATGTWISKVVYLPNGTYLVRSTVRQKEPPYTVGPHLQGQSKEGTVIRLADGTWPTVTGLNFVLSTGNGVAQCFNRGVRNITVNIGSNNAGASGIWWYGNNAALLTDVDVISEDGQGVIGLDAGTGESGPSMVRNLYVRGFRIGVQVAALNAVTFFNIKVEGQSQYGILARQINCPAWFDRVESINRVTAFRSEGGCKAVLVDANFSGGADSCEAIWNYSGANLFARNVTTSGYRGAIYTPSTIQTLDKIPTGMYIDEFSSHKSLTQFGTAQRSLNLPNKTPPEPEWEQDMNKWAVVSDYLSGRSDAEALQAAIDDQSKTSIAIDREMDLGQTVYVRNNIKMIYGTVAFLRGSGLEVVDGNAPVVKIWNIGGNSSVTQRSSRTVILESLLMGAVGDGSGDLFLTDHVAGMDIRNSQQNVWAWHFNSEGSGINLSAGTIRCFGWKTEHDGTKVRASGGTLEMLGFYMYAPEGVKPPPLLEIANTEFSMAMMSQFTFGENSLYEHIIQETKNGETKSIYAADNLNGWGYNLPLYISHSRQAQVGSHPRLAQSAAVQHSKNRRLVVPTLRAGGLYGTLSGGRVYDLRGKLVNPSGDRMGTLSGSATGVYIIRDAASDNAPR